jgi:micrococcal nuclease
VKFLVYVCLMASVCSSFVAQASLEFRVVSCNDGDTCRLAKGDGNKAMKVRLVGIDAPELSHGGQPYGKESKDFLNQMVVGKSVRLQSLGQDTYGRTLGVLLVGSVDVNESMIRAGMAEVYVGKTEDGVDSDRYFKAQQEARSARRGMWAQARYESPYQFRKRTK